MAYILTSKTKTAENETEDHELEITGLEIHELLAEKMQIDDQLNQLKQGRPA